MCNLAMFFAPPSSLPSSPFCVHSFLVCLSLFFLSSLTQSTPSLLHLTLLSFADFPHNTSSPSSSYLVLTVLVSLSLSAFCPALFLYSISITSLCPRLNKLCLQYKMHWPVVCSVLSARQIVCVRARGLHYCFKVNTFFKKNEINTFNQQRCIKLIKIDSEDFYIVRKDLYVK